MRIQVVNILCFHHLPVRLPALGITSMVVFSLFFCLFLILVFNNFQELCPQKLISTFSWVISYLLFFQMYGFELLLLGKNQKVLKVQATLMNTLLAQYIQRHLIMVWFFFFFSFSFRRSGHILFCTRFYFGGKSRFCIYPYTRDS